MKKFLRFLLILAIASIASLGNVSAIENSELPELYIKSINPGYLVDDKNNVGEYIELARPHSDTLTPLSLAGFSISYTNSSGNTITLYEFPEYLWMSGETILLRLASSPESEQADLTYTKTLAFKAGPLELKKATTVLDSVCWTGQEGCAKEFKSSSPTLLLRDPETFEFIHQDTSVYSPAYDSAAPNTYYESRGSEETPPKQCQNLTFSEILSYYEDSQSEQFIEFYNPTSEQILLDGCFIKYKNKTYQLSGIIKSDSYLVQRPNGLSLTKNPTTSNIIELYDVDGTIVDTLTYSNGQQKSTSYAQIGYNEKGEEIWKSTYAVTPGEANIYQQFKTCEEGKVINESTGNCVKATTATEIVCDADQYLNPLTGRCKKYETETEIECKEGYELNPETNRCRRIKNNDGADYELESTVDGDSSIVFIAITATIIIFVLAIIYIVFEFRTEIKKFFQKVLQRFRKKQRP